jgi:hypothetical protein
VHFFMRALTILFNSFLQFISKNLCLVGCLHLYKSVFDSNLPRCFCLLVCCFLPTQ